jgi:hypothetical protein
MSNNIIVYTAIIGNHDYMRSDILCFHEDSMFIDSRRNARMYKVLSHLFVEADYSIWIDGNIFLQVDPEEMIDNLGSKDIAVVRHPNHKCIYTEAKTIINAGLDDADVVREQMVRYSLSGYKKNLGLAMTGILIRKHTHRIKRLNEQWWAEICRGSKRDQLSFNYVFGQDISYIDWPGSYNNDWFKRPNHKISFSKRLRKYILSPIKHNYLRLIKQ